uniref:DUF659 domain-containing protein n=1 Tax=Ditylenchus dipsaci TaxID=166011 RepID=A0A915ELA7_9BILA
MSRIRQNIGDSYIWASVDETTDIKRRYVANLLVGKLDSEEQIRFLFPDVDKLISNVKKVFTKAPTRISLFRELCSNFPLPPAPILTRWGTWIEAAVYYSRNFDQIKAVINKLDEEDAISIKLSQQAFASLETAQMLAYIQSTSP